MSGYIRVYLWRHDGYFVNDDRWQSAIDAIDNGLNSQIDEMNVTTYDYSHREHFTGVSNHDSGSSLVNAFADHVKEHTVGSPQPEEIHLLLYSAGTSLGLPAGQTIGSVGEGRGHDFFGDDGVAGIVNAYSYYMGHVYGADYEGAFRNTVIHEVFHGLTDDEMWYYDSPDLTCRSPDDSSPDHSLGKVTSGLTTLNSVTPMATWYNPDSLNDRPCSNCDGKKNGHAVGTSRSFTDCAQREAKKHLLMQF